MTLMMKSVGENVHLLFLLRVMITLMMKSVGEDVDLSFLLRVMIMSNCDVNVLFRRGEKKIRGRVTRRGGGGTSATSIGFIFVECHGDVLIFVSYIHPQSNSNSMFSTKPPDPPQKSSRTQIKFITTSINRAAAATVDGARLRRPSIKFVPSSHGSSSSTLVPSRSPRPTGARGVSHTL